MKKTLLFVMLVAMATMAGAEKVTREEAGHVANYYLALKKQAAQQDVQLTNYTPLSGATGVTCHVFNYSGGGFAIVSADDLYFPIIGYSTSGRFDVERLSESQRDFVLNYQHQVDYLRANASIRDADVARAWAALRSHTWNEGKTLRGVEPLLHDTWDQNDPYNFHCPADDEGPGGHVYAGCNATAMSQIMHYWRWPDQGTGQSSYYCPGYGTLSANYGQTQYHFDGMVHNCSYYNSFVAQLQYHAGVSVRMEYGPNGSSAYANDTPTALINYFKYKPTATYLSKSNFSQTVWEQKIKSEIDLGRPIEYKGHTATAGHAFVLCGYNDDVPTLYYFNFGWSGNGNGYFSITDVGGWNSNQAMVYQIEPDDEYPLAPSAMNQMTFLEGSVEDGSGPRDDYAPNSDLRWLIDPQTEEDTVTRIVLTSIRFDLGTGDLLRVYDGADENAPLLGEYSAANPFTSLESTGNVMLIRFTSDATSNGNGFLLEYESVQPSFCAGTKTFTEVSGIFNDGSGSFNYKPNASCSFKIQPPYASQITLYFNYFNSEPEHDYLKVINSSTSQTLAILSGEYTTPPAPIVVEGGKAYLMWRTNEWVQNEGFEVRWETMNVGEEEAALLSGFSLWPNPVSDVLHATFDASTQNSIVLSIVNQAGQTLVSRQINGQATPGVVALDVKHLPCGIYSLLITGANGRCIRKFVKGN